MIHSAAMSSIAERDSPSSSRFSSRPKVTFLSTVRCGNELYFWKIMPRSRPGPVTGRLRTRTSPVVGG